mmetsp:Transcript_72780/g.106716  ORF Transcript_72780/g.106716 Transcript_72780/m.106716 type:complete len:123 (-) Transcript_72780:550-918(-)
MLELAQDSSFRVRASASSALGALCAYGHPLSEQAVLALIKTISRKDEDQLVCSHAAAALEHIARAADVKAWQVIDEWRERERECEAEEEARSAIPLSAEQAANIRAQHILDMAVTADDDDSD